jgi:hypothetical protein
MDGLSLVQTLAQLFYRWPLRKFTRFLQEVIG